MTRAEARVRVAFASAADARQAAASLAPDDDAHVETDVDGATLEVTVAADGPGPLQAALDDVLANLYLLRDVADVADEADETP